MSDADRSAAADHTTAFTPDFTGGFAAQSVLDERPVDRPSAVDDGLRDDGTGTGTGTGLSESVTDEDHGSSRLDDRADPEPVPPHSPPVVIPGIPQFLDRGRFLLVLAAVWLLAAAAGAGQYYWWYHSADKTMPVFVVLVVAVACIVGSLLTAMVQSKPGVSALAIAMMSAPLASAAGAAVLYGGYVFGWVAH